MAPFNSKLEKQFDQIQKNGLNTVDNILCWIHNSNVISAPDDANARELFKDCLDTNMVDKDKFKAVLLCLAKDHDLATIQRQLTTHLPNFVETYQAASKTYQSHRKRKPDSPTETISLTETESTEAESDSCDGL